MKQKPGKSLAFLLVLDIRNDYNDKGGKSMARNKVLPKNPGREVPGPGKGYKKLERLDLPLHKRLRRTPAVKKVPKM